MLIEFSKEYLIELLQKQLSFFLVTKEEIDIVSANLNAVLYRLETCFEKNANKYYSKNGQTYFNPFHSGQWAIFLYYLSNTMYNNQKDNIAICNKIYYLNKMLNGCDILYETKLPDIYMSDHPVGTVMGKGSFSNYFSFCQGCTVGNNKGIYPVFGEYVTMLANSSVLGNCSIGNNVIISTNTLIKDQSVPDNSIVFGTSPNLVIKPNNLGILNFKSD